MNAHVPDHDRAKALEKAGFRQNTIFVWALTEIKSEDPEHRHNEWRCVTREKATLAEIEGCPYYRLVAAPIVTELVEEIVKIDPTYSVVTSSRKDDCRVGFAGRHFNYADTLPNALKNRGKVVPFKAEVK